MMGGTRKGRLAGVSVIVAVHVALAAMPSAMLAKPHQAASATSAHHSKKHSGGNAHAHSSQLPCPTLPAADQFSTTIDNRFLPLAPGTTFTYQETIGRHHTQQTDVVQVTSETKTILGVSTVVVHDTAKDANGAVVEDTLDWYAQDAAGNVWYFGEDTKEYQNGQVTSTQGSWQAGISGAMPGIVMEANPRVGDAYRQECADHQAADQAKVLDLATSVPVPFGTFDGVLLTQETTPLDPGQIEQKQYAPCVGMVRSKIVQGGKEVAQLIAVQGPVHPSSSTCDSSSPSQPSARGKGGSGKGGGKNGGHGHHHHGGKNGHHAHHHGGKKGGHAHHHHTSKAKHSHAQGGGKGRSAGRSQSSSAQPRGRS